MTSFANFVKQWLIPGSMPFLFLGIVAGVMLLNAGPVALTAGRALLTALALLYWCLSLPAVANALIASLGQRYGTIDRPETAAGARVLVVVGNGSVHYTDGRCAVDYLTRRSVFCVFEAARLNALLNPDLVISTGGVAGNVNARPESELMRDLLVTCAVPAEKIVAESRSRTTAEQVANVLALVGQRQVTGPLVVVTTPAHMTRVITLFNQHGARTVPSITPELRYDEGREGWRRWWPSMSALTGSSSAMYEYLANVQAAGRAQRKAG
jgi:uncharacterized SAM-binding protein YcdF (DUF218 family)